MAARDQCSDVSECKEPVDRRGDHRSSSKFPWRCHRRSHGSVAEGFSARQKSDRIAKPSANPRRMLGRAGPPAFSTTGNGRPVNVHAEPQSVRARATVRATESGLPRRHSPRCPRRHHVGVLVTEDPRIFPAATFRSTSSDNLDNARGGAVGLHQPPGRHCCHCHGAVLASSGGIGQARARHRTGFGGFVGPARPPRDRDRVADPRRRAGMIPS